MLIEGRTGEPNSERSAGIVRGGMLFCDFSRVRLLDQLVVQDRHLNLEIRDNDGLAAQLLHERTAKPT